MRFGASGVTLVGIHWPSVVKQRTSYLMWISGKPLPLCWCHRLSLLQLLYDEGLADGSQSVGEGCGMCKDPWFCWPIVKNICG